MGGPQGVNETGAKFSISIQNFYFITSEKNEIFSRFFYFEFDTSKNREKFADDVGVNRF